MSEATVNDLAEVFGPPVREELVPCTTDQWNHPFPPEQPFVRGDRCAVCDQPVQWVQFQDDNPNLFSRRAEPHQRLKRWFAVADFDLEDLRRERY